jgi:hypothetical protein
LALPCLLPLVLNQFHSLRKPPLRERSDFLVNIKGVK